MVQGTVWIKGLILITCVNVYGPRPIATIDFQVEFGVQLLWYIRLLDAAVTR